MQHNELKLVGENEQLLAQASQILAQAHLVVKEKQTKSPLKKLRKETAQAVVIPLHQLPAPVEDDLVIAALFDRTSPAISLYVAPSAQAKKPFGIKKKATVHCRNLLEACQLPDFRPDLKTVVSAKSISALLDDEACEGFLATEQALFLANLDAEASEKFQTYTCFEFNPVEFIPLPGQGATALVTQMADKPSRRLLKNIHQEEIARQTNIERRLPLLAPEVADRLGAYCEVDANGYYHLYAVLATDERPRYAKASASSHIGLVEKVLGEFPLWEKNGFSQRH